MANPTDLTRKAWDKAKELTVPKTGFGDKLDAYAAARKKTIDLPTRNLAAYKAAAVALENIGKHVPTALAKCNKTLHKNTIAALGAYKSLIDKEGIALSAEATKYQGYVDKYKHLREVCGTELKQIKTQMEALANKALDGTKPYVKAGNVLAVDKIVNDTLPKLGKLQEAANDSIAKPRVSPPAVEAPHADDRPPASVFSALIDTQNEIIGVRKHAEGELAQALKDAKKNKPVDPKPKLKNIVVKMGSTELGTGKKGAYDRAAKLLVIDELVWKVKGMDPLKVLQKEVQVAADFEDAEEDGNFTAKMKIEGINGNMKTVKLKG